jgi:uncharacterized protein
VPTTGRILALDAARGLALLGILIVNIDFASLPVSAALEVVPVNEHTTRDRLLFYLSHVFCTGKFYGLFSLLFGIGFALQRRRLLHTGRFIPIYLRRVFFLGALGVVHALGLWYGDILFPYALAALLLLALGSLTPRALVAIGVSLILLVALFSSLITLVTPIEQSALQGVPIPHVPPPDPAATRGPFLQLLDLWRDGKAYSFTDPEWVRLEIEAHRHGPLPDLLLFRLISWVLMLLFMLLGFGWTVVAMFCIGSAMLKAGAFDAAHLRLHRRLLLAGLALGLPMVATAYGIVSVDLTPRTLAIHTLLHTLGAPLMSLAYLSGVTLLAHSGRARRAIAALACTGRLALTNYLMQSLLMSTIFLFYGLGLYAQTTRAERFAMTLAVYAFQVAFSVLYLRRFRQGPLEWLWRRATYGRAPASHAHT